MISATERRALRARAHPLKPVVLLGQHGVTPAVVAAIDEALATHELIKIRLRGVERESREPVINDIAARMNAEIVDAIGHILTLFRANPKPVPPPVKPRKKIARRGAPHASDPPRKPSVTRRSAAPRKSPAKRGPK